MIINLSVNALFFPFLYLIVITLYQLIHLPM